MIIVKIQNDIIMEAELNIANILKDKPNGTKLYADAFGELSFERVNLSSDNSIYVKTKSFNRCSFYSDGKYTKDGEPVLVPSKKMRDWNKFAWKKGDILVSNDGKTNVIFNKWEDDSYASFYGRHYLNNENKDKALYYKTFVCTTEMYSIANKDVAKDYISSIEEKFGGKLNLKTLEIDKSQYQFKPFEKVLVRDNRNEPWRAAFFSYINEYKRYVTTSMAWKYCIPYEGNESLLGTIKDVKE